MQPVKLLGRAASTAIHTMRHPISSAAYTAGVARGLAGAAFHAVVPSGHHAGHHADTGPSPVPTQRAATPEAAPAVPEPQRVPKPVPTADELPEPIVIVADDEEPGESFATEPKAVNRESAHGESTATTDAEIDAWEDEAAAAVREDDVDIETPVGTTGAGVGHNPDTAEADLQQPLTQPLLDPAEAKALRKETETLRKAADTQSE